MEEIKLLVELLNSLPTLAVWVLVLFFCYKTIIVGSIYGLIKFCVLKLHDWLTAPKKVTYDLGSEVFTNCLQDLLTQVSRIKNKGLATGSIYIHETDVAWLRKAIDAQEAADRLASK